MTGPLHTTRTGDGERTAVLLHGMSGDSTDWWPVVPDLVERGYRVVAVDLPGHGRSPTDPAATPASVGAAILASLPARPALAIGASLGGIVLATIVEDLAPERAAYVDAPFRLPHFGDAEVLHQVFQGMQDARTLEQLRRDRPGWTEEALRIRAASAAAWDVTTSASLYAGLDGADVTPSCTRPSLVVRADPSAYVDDAEAERLAGLGFTVRSIPGADHTVWQSHKPELLTALDAWR